MVFVRSIFQFIFLTKVWVEILLKVEFPDRRIAGRFKNCIYFEKSESIYIYQIDFQAVATTWYKFILRVLKSVIKRRKKQW